MPCGCAPLPERQLTSSIGNRCRRSIPFDPWTTCWRLRTSDTSRKACIENSMEMPWLTLLAGLTGRLERPAQPVICPLLYLGQPPPHPCGLHLLLPLPASADLIFLDNDHIDDFGGHQCRISFS